MKVMNLAALVLDARLQSRVEINEDAVSEYANDITGGDQFPPVTTFFDGVHFYLADGYHRYHAHKRAGKVSIQCEIINGTLRDAIYYSTAVNAKHGMRRSYADRRKAVMTLLDDFEWSLKSNTEIAKHCGVSISFVSNLRNSSGKMPDKIEYTTPSGETKTKVKASGRPAKPKAEEPPKAPEPEPEPEEFDARDELIAAFLNSGTLHILSDSGMNVAMADGSSRFIVDSIDCGNLGTAMNNRSTGARRMARMHSGGVSSVTSSSIPSAARICSLIGTDFCCLLKTPPPRLIRLGS
jgi:hypothetical protein